ncbi:MAG: DUF3135 domain-containing protein [Pseudomonadota bacterium]
MKHKLPAFDVLVDLARNDPERLERLRKKLTEDIIDSASDEQRRKRLAGLQFRVDMERERARSPLQATIRISEMMCQSLAELHRSMVTPFEKEAQSPAASLPAQTPSAMKGTAPRKTTVEAETETAAILPFPGKADTPVDNERS